VGLGLSVVARLAAKMNCEVKVQSTLGKGSCFSLVLPVTEASYAQSSQEDAVAVTTFNGLRAFCVDDQQENLDALQVLLEKWGMDVSLTTQPQEADGLAKIHSPNLLMIDYQLGEDQMDGIELILSLKNALPDNVPAILITANRESDIRTRCKELGIYYLNKPIKPHRLKALLKSLL
jgi:CheY-like chemotaxis protein